MKSRGDQKPQVIAGLPGAVSGIEALPPILLGRSTPEVRRRVEGFYASVAEIFEKWVERRPSPHTQRAYRSDVLSFVSFVGYDWPKESWRLLTTSVTDVLRWRDFQVEREYAPKTMNRRISSLSSFYKYLAAAAAEMRLPITVPNPAHAQFIARAERDAVRETKALTATRARQIMGLPAGDTVLDARDRAILRFYLYSGARISTGCKLNVSDFHQDGEEATVRLSEKGGKRRTIGIHFSAAEAMSEYIDLAGLSSGPLFRARRGSKSECLSETRISTVTMYRVIEKYLGRIPGAVRDMELPGGGVVQRCVYTPHSLRATTATLLLDAGVDITKVQELLGHRHVTTTQIYDKRRRTTKESASHDVPI